MLRIASPSLAMLRIVHHMPVYETTFPSNSWIRRGVRAM
jgi:hypothetical protein